jgi:tetratricopeptide (TPR) repeat protein
LVGYPPSGQLLISNFSRKIDTFHHIESLVFLCYSYRMGKVENYINFAKVVLNPDKNFDDLDCAGVGLQEILTTLDPENAEAALLLKEIIAEINRRFDAGITRGCECHLIAGWESPSPYIREQEYGEALSKQKDWHGLLEWCQRSTEKYPQCSVTWALFGDAFYNLNRFNEALNSFRQALLINSKNVHARYYLGLTYEKLNRFNDALDSFHQALRIDPKWALTCWLCIGRVYRQLKRVDESIDALLQALHIDPECDLVWSGLAITYHYSSNRTAALDAVRELRRLNPEYADKLYNLIMTH